jgi:Ca2+-binding EF-hand superfamily protein
MGEPDWERVQKKTFTKWVNNHLNREWGASHQIEDVITAWETGIPLMELAVALYKENEKNPEQAISMPKLKEREKAAAQRIQKITNLNNAIDLLKKAGVTLRGVSAENLCDHEAKDKPTILGMVFIIILDYASRGFGGTASEVKQALLQWVNKKTEGYERVNPPGVKNFTKDWRNGLAWCALIHRHCPDLIDYEKCLQSSNAENLETAFSVADEKLGIARLLDVEDMDVDMPDEKSVITYTMEYFLRFANEGLKEGAAKQASDWLSFLRGIREQQNDYERRARLLCGWCGEQGANWANFNFGETKEDAIAAFNKHREFVTAVKPDQEGEKMDLEALFAEIQSILKVNGLKPYSPPAELTPEAVDGTFDTMVSAQRTHGAAIRENRFKFVEKKEDKTGDELQAQILESFKHYDTNNSMTLNKQEFNAACMEMGIALKTQDEKDKLFDKLAAGQEEISFDQFKAWMVSRLVVSLDDPESIKNAFKTLADGADTLTEGQMGTQGISAEDKAFMMEHMSKNGDERYDYAAFVDQMMD